MTTANNAQAIHRTASASTAAVLKENTWLTASLDPALKLQFTQAVHDALYTVWYGLSQPGGTDWNLCIHLQPPFPEWEPAELVAELQGLPDASHERELAKLLAKWVRVGAQAGIPAEYRTGPQMARFNPAVRSALYSVLVATSIHAQDPRARAYLEGLAPFEPTTLPKLAVTPEQVKIAADTVRGWVQART